MWFCLVPQLHLNFSHYPLDIYIKQLPEFGVLNLFSEMSFTSISFSNNLAFLWKSSNNEPIYKMMSLLLENMIDN